MTNKVNIKVFGRDFLVPRTIGVMWMLFMLAFVFSCMYVAICGLVLAGGLPLAILFLTICIEITINGKKYRLISNDILHKFFSRGVMIWGIIAFFLEDIMKLFFK